MGLEYKDLTGRDIQVGNYIAFSATSGRAAIMRIGMVIALTKNSVRQNRYNYTTKEYEKYDEPKVKMLRVSFREQYVLDANNELAKDAEGNIKKLGPAWQADGCSTVAKLNHMLIVSPSGFDNQMITALTTGAAKHGVVPLETIDIKRQIKNLIAENGIENVAVAFDEQQENHAKVQQTSEVVHSSGDVLTDYPA